MLSASRLLHTDGICSRGRDDMLKDRGYARIGGVLVIMESMIGRYVFKHRTADGVMELRIPLQDRTEGFAIVDVDGDVYVYRKPYGGAYGRELMVQHRNAMRDGRSGVDASLVMENMLECIDTLK